MERAGRLIGKMKDRSLNEEEIARAAWPAAVGRKIAARTSAVSLVRGCLIVEVEDALWQRQLNMMRSQIIRRLQEVGAACVADIAFKPGIPRREPQRAETPRQDFALTADEASAIRDPVLRRVYINSRKKATA